MKTINKIFGAMTIFALIAVVCGATWHIASAAICYGMHRLTKE